VPGLALSLDKMSTMTRKSWLEADDMDAIAKVRRRLQTMEAARASSALLARRPKSSGERESSVVSV